MHLVNLLVNRRLKTLFDGTRGTHLSFPLDESCFLGSIAALSWPCINGAGTVRTAEKAMPLRRWDHTDNVYIF